MSRQSVFFLFGVCLSILVADDGYCQKALEKRHFHFDATLLNATPHEHFLRELKGIHAGDVVHATLLLHNNVVDDNQGLELESAEASCKCTETKIPKITVAHNSYAKMEFTFKVDNAPTALRQNYDVKIQTKGPIDEIHLRFFADLAEYVSFARKDFNRVFAQGEKEILIRIPLVFSDEAVLQNVSLTGKDGLIATKGQIKREGARAFVDATVSIPPTPDEIIAGSLHLMKGETVLSTLNCVLEKSRPLELLPNRVTFVPSESEDKVRIANVMLRVRPREKKEDGIIRAVTCTTSDGNTLQTTANQVSPSLTRIRIFVRDLVELPIDGKLYWKVENNDGSMSTFQSDFLVSN